jgi:hypothetical protein
MTFAYWCIFAAMLMPLGCVFYAKKSAGFVFTRDNGNPRAFLEKAEGAAARADAAQQNCFEAFAPFAAAVIVAHATGNAAQSVINIWAGLFVLFRLLFIFCYIADEPRLRSMMWSAGFVCIIALFVAAV